MARTAYDFVSVKSLPASSAKAEFGRHRPLGLAAQTTLLPESSAMEAPPAVL